MAPRALCLAAFLALAALAPRAAVAEVAPLPADLGLGTYRALLVGVQSYPEGSGIADLRTPIADVSAIARVLHEKYGFAEVEVLVGGSATRARILGELRDLRNAAGPDDAVVIYFAGHGVWDDEAQQGYWLPADAERDNPANWISNADVRDALMALPARHVLLVSDACFSGSLIGMRDLAGAEPVEDLVMARRMAEKKSRWVLTSGGAEPVVDAHLSTGHSVFAWCFLNVLLEQERPFVNLGSFLDALQRRVVNSAPQTPQAAPVRMAGDEGGQMVLVNAAQHGAGPSEAALPEPTEVTVPVVEGAFAEALAEGAPEAAEPVAVTPQSAEQAFAEAAAEWEPAVPADLVGAEEEAPEPPIIQGMAVPDPFAAVFAEAARSEVIHPPKRAGIELPLTMIGPHTVDATGRRVPWSEIKEIALRSERAGRAIQLRRRGNALTIVGSTIGVTAGMGSFRMFQDAIADDNVLSFLGGYFLFPAAAGGLVMALSGAAVSRHGRELAVQTVNRSNYY